MPPEAKKPDESVYEAGLLYERRNTEQIEGLQKEVLDLRGSVDSHANERRQDWTRVNQWALAANIALFSVAVVVAIGVTTHNFFLSADMRSQGERLAVVEERLRAFTELPP